ncbi:MAG: hypothetical protein B0W54_11095 [Cellvibrio sp. 79]|nr:MAG: hypothetical protein B0W54_11095 [Cellvibrio sp. 79]
MALPDTTHRVALHTSDKVNIQIAEATQRSIAYYRSHPAEIPARLKKLDREWDIERILETNAATLIIISSILGFTMSILFFVVPLLVGAFLLQHALQGWCPPLPVMRRIGFRTSTEIEIERKALEKITHRPDASLF